MTAPGTTAGTPAQDTDASLDHALRSLVAMPGWPPGVICHQDRFQLDLIYLLDSLAPRIECGRLLVCLPAQILLNKALIAVCLSGSFDHGGAVKKTVLNGFDKAVSDLKRVLDNDVLLEEHDQLYLENRLLLLQVAYAEWKSRQLKKDPLP